VSSLVAMDKAGATSNTCIFQPGGAGIGSPRIFEKLSTPTVDRYLAVLGVRLGEQTRAATVDDPVV
jgi:hypothetical protein